MRAFMQGDGRPAILGAFREENMRKIGILAAALAFTSPAVAMGSGGGYGGGFSGGAGNSGSFDEYATAIRLIHHEKYGDAIPHLQSALTDKPHSADILNYLGYTERMVGNYNYSMAYYQQALKEDPDHKGAHEYLGELYLNLHDLPSAQAQLATLNQLCPSGCDEVVALTKSIATYQAAFPNGAPAATSDATPATPAQPAAPAQPATPAAPAP
jgi:tetratricopeptide (TPR) repeat protein